MRKNQYKRMQVKFEFIKLLKYIALVTAVLFIYLVFSSNITSALGDSTIKPNKAKEHSGKIDNENKSRKQAVADSSKESENMPKPNDSKDSSSGDSKGNSSDRREERTISDFHPSAITPPTQSKWLINLFNSITVILAIIVIILLRMTYKLSCEIEDLSDGIKSPNNRGKTTPDIKKSKELENRIDNLKNTLDSNYKDIRSKFNNYEDKHQRIERTLHNIQNSVQEINSKNQKQNNTNTSLNNGHTASLEPRVDKPQMYSWSEPNVPTSEPRIKVYEQSNPHREMVELYNKGPEESFKEKYDGKIMYLGIINEKERKENPGTEPIFNKREVITYWGIQTEGGTKLLTFPKKGMNLNSKLTLHANAIDSAFDWNGEPTDKFKVISPAIFLSSDNAYRVGSKGTIEFI